MTAKEQVWIEAANRLNGWGEMKQEDTPTAIQTTQIDMAVLLKLQKDRDLAVAALKDIRVRTHDSVARDALAQIEEGK